MDMENEIWRDIIGYEGLYQISNFGRVRSLDRVEKCRDGKLRKRKGIIIILHKNTRGGYLIVTLSKHGVHKTFQVHRLEWEMFYGPIPEDMQVNHINEIKTDNRLENLNLMTPKENSNWGTHTDRVAISQRNRPDTSKTVLQYTADGVFVREWPSTKEIQRCLGFANPNISACCLGKKETAYGYIWRYAV